MLTHLSELFVPVVIIAFMYWYYHQRNKDNHFYKNIPGPPTVPVFGNALDFGFEGTKILETLTEYNKKYGDIVKVQIGPIRKFVVVADYDFLECILSSTKLLNKSYDYNFLKPWLGTGLLTSAGPKWKKRRRILTPTFHFQILTQFIEVFESCGQKLNEKLEKQVGKGSVDIYPLVTLCALDVICESAMGISVNAQDNENSVYVRSVKEMCKIVVDRAVSPLGMYDSLFPLTKNYYIQKRALNILHGYTRNVIKSRQENKQEETIQDDTIGLTKNKKAFLDLLLDVRVDDKPLTPEEIREEVDTFMFEGHDTTASAISFALYCLANHPDVQKKAFEEQSILFEDLQNCTVTYTDLQNMKYLELVIKETLRLYPSVPLFARETTKEVEFDNLALPEGDTLMIFAFAIHRNPKYFKDPETFNPSRFESIDGKLPYAYIPFSAGPRNCIGQKFAMLEMKSTLSQILRRFELLSAVPHHDLKLVGETILKSQSGIRIQLKLRE